MTDIPHAGAGPWRAFSYGQHPRGPFRMEFRGMWQPDGPWGQSPETLDEAERVCALLNHGHQLAERLVKADIRARLGL